MKLGNSNGNNKGKKYFVRGRDDQDLDVVYAEKAEEFTLWFAQNYRATKSQLRTKGNYDDDMFSETYIRIYEIILYTGRAIRDYASYFHRAYFTNFIQAKTKSAHYCELFDNYDREEDLDEEAVELDKKSVLLSDEIMRYVFDNYDIRDFEIFKMYVNLKPAVNYQALARMTEQKYHVIQRMISNIMRDVSGNQMFMSRRREMTIPSPISSHWGVNHPYSASHQRGEVADA